VIPERLPMEFEILDTNDQTEIQKSSSQLTEENIFEISTKARSVLTQLNPREFVFLMGSLAKFGTNFNNNIKLIGLYLQNVNDDGVKLELETMLYSLFLKKYESEENFRQFFNIFNANYKRQIGPENKKILSKSIWFFTHTPVFLAHTNAMFALLETRHDRDIKIIIASLNDNIEYRNKCMEVGASFEVLKGQNLSEKYEMLIEKSRNSLSLCWNGAPVNLGYVSKISNNTIFWSHRFHSKFEHVKLRLSAASKDRKDTFHYFGHKWHYFDSNFSIKNWNKTADWKIRQHNFGSFCRENLIDNIDHWTNIKTILATNVKLVYHYAGRKKIHENWCQELDIDIQRIRFLGWLREPETIIMDMAFLLDSEVLGHGLMGMEALAGKIPILQKYKTPGFYSNFLGHMDQEVVEKDVLARARETAFRDQKELSSIVTALLKKNENENLGLLLNKKLAKRHTERGTFNDFINLIKNCANI
jgi:hypothetical protein